MRRSLLMTLAALALTASGCGPKPSLQVGLKDYNTDIVFGAKKRPPTPPPLPVFDLTPSFPGFIQPPVPITLPATVPTTTTTTAPPLKPECPQADVLQIPPPAETVITKAPTAGLYPYRQTRQDGPGAQPTPVAGGQVRQVTNVHTDAGGNLAWDVVIAGADGSTTTTSYAVVKATGNNGADGLYMTRVSMLVPGDPTPKTFTPVDGLRIFPMPADSGVTWRSAATDPLTGRAQSLTGVIQERRRVDACGIVVEGWAAVVDITVVGPDDKGVPTQSEILATFVVAPQLGGLIVGDTVQTKTATQDVTIDSVINTVAPKPKK
ncbi:MAG TPA: hypothetical protein VFA94_11800 [Acidimicrobiales bacterium]|nr:hypothetical protein [Acidimicrobiales bacterium]